MSEEKKLSVFEIQLEMNQLMNDRVDLLVKWNQELTEIVKLLTTRVTSMDHICNCKSGEM
jgi:hypothetical protein